MDPAWMRSNEDNEAKRRQFSNEDTFYPAGTECYRDPSQGSCFLFGNSGSGLVRPFNKSSPDQHAYTGPLSMSKSCDQIWLLNKAIQYSSENPGVFTDAYCYLPWIAAVYGMKLPESYTSKESCSKTIGNKNNINLEDCMGQDVELLYKECKNSTLCVNELVPTGLFDTYFGRQSCPDDNAPNEDQRRQAYVGYIPGQRLRKCDFTFKDAKGSVWDECRLQSEEGYAYNIYTCKVSCYSFKSLNQSVFSRTRMGIHLLAPTTAKE